MMSEAHFQALPTDPGIHEVTLEPGHRRVALALPAVTGQTERPELGIPLVVALHYGGPIYPFKGGEMLRMIVGPALRPLQALIAAPDCNHAFWANEQSEKEVLALVDRLKTAYEVDPARILLTGISQGGIGAWYIGGRTQELFATVMPVAAAVPPAAFEQPWRTPLLVVHSRDDEYFPLVQVESRLADLRTAGAEMATIFLEGIGHHEVARLVEPLAGTVPWIRQVWNQAGEDV